MRASSPRTKTAAGLLAAAATIGIGIAAIPVDAGVAGTGGPDSPAFTSKPTVRVEA